MPVDNGRAIAYHEIGHAMGALLCGERVLAVHTAQPGQGGFIDWHGRSGDSCTGLCETGLRPFKADMAQRRLDDDPQRWWPILWTRAVNHAFFCGAGPIIEAKSRGFALTRGGLSDTSGVEADLERAMTGLEPFEANAAERERLVWRLWERAAGVITRPAVWQAVCVLAQRAMPRPEGPVRLDGAEIESRARAYATNLPVEPLTTVAPGLQDLAAEI